MTLIKKFKEQLRKVKHEGEEGGKEDYLLEICLSYLENAEVY